MVANAFFASTIILMALGIYLLGECRFLVPYKRILFENHGHVIATFAAALYINLFAAFYTLLRKLFLKDTGRKLAHMEKELRTGGAISRELAERLKES